MEHQCLRRVVETNMSQKQKIEYPTSAGGIVCRRTDDDDLQIVICGRNGPGTWNLPKGTPNPGESLEETALREVREETGLLVDLQSYIDSVKYWFVRPSDGVKCHKTVHFYLMVPRGGSPSDHDPEFDEVKWVKAQDALTLLTYENEAKIVEKAISMVAEETKNQRNTAQR